MHFTKKKPSEKRITLKNKLKKQNILKFPGAYNPLTAKLITEIGCNGIYISGAVTATKVVATIKLSSFGKKAVEAVNATIQALGLTN